VAIDVADARLEAARKFGADIVVNSADQDVRLLIDELTGGLGADVAMEAVGLPETFEQAIRLVRPGGHVANIGVHGRPATLHLEQIWIKNLTITTGLVDTPTIPTLIDLMSNHQIDPGPMITHRFTMDEFETAYDVFGRPAETGALKVLVAP
jgi:alcohol dehydrogenase